MVITAPNITFGAVGEFMKIGIIDADYYNNPSNEGEIFLQLINLSPFNTSFILANYNKLWNKKISLL